MSTVIITGAGSGIGLAVATKLAALEYNVVVNDYDADAAERAAEEVGGVAVQGDVSNEADVVRMVAQCTKAFGAPTHLVNNAGHVHQSRFVDLAPEDFDRMIAVHLRGTYLCTRAVLPQMLANKDGCVVNMASQLGQIGGIELVHYSAAKAGIIGMTKALAREVSTQGVRVNAVAPGPINTPLVRALSDDWRAAKAADLPLGHFGEPEDVAETVAFLCSDAARIYVGQTLSPNSGDVML
ncbi:SDR family oxidoreductase [Sulfitobacter sp. KE29]|uniref:SDR family NAD(P)-dependent oxidoreductase n=1 Tax=unclassified Sulfitobacter TaxID=196795 RepID=UPI0010ACFC0B|nr:MULTISPECIES: SDR family oxidoreductase [unclassified Sulfitobacter]MBO9437224.1 SDR family oxidoreductase [Sulfitobacter sp. R18_2]MDF3419282.1 SDR family oxidoreductase [Sulfitobacter sp. Ks38]MDF3426764.1 SDR family oxidoreductase [Sulfitobacter sp. KE29]MDF3430345.1 SDR family oxidoreductase [Sulfitobacter sp. S46]MDF3445117.1 SDR family oxidoreductase [Sulfitobacter sp. KE31]